MSPVLRHLDFSTSDDADGVLTLEAQAATPAARHAAVLVEVQQVLDWAWQQFPQGHGPVADGMDWDHDLALTVEEGGWHVVTLTLAASPGFAEAFLARFASTPD